MFTDFVLNGQAHGDVANMVANGGYGMGGVRFDPGLLRPYIDRKGNQCVDVNTGQVVFNEKTGNVDPVIQKMTVNQARDAGLPVLNTTTTLRKDEWLMMDAAVLKAARARLRAWADLRAANTFGGFDGMSKIMLEHERMTDPGEAIVDMDGLTEGRGDSPQFQLEGLPLPITHSSFRLTQRRMAVSRNTGTPLDMLQAESAGRRVAESIEKVTIGVEATAALGQKTARGYSDDDKVYGYRTAPDRITKTDITAADGTNADTVVSEVLTMRGLAYAQNFFGPFILYHSSDMDTYLDNDYAMTTGSNYGVAPALTLRERLARIDGINAVRRLDYFTSTNELLLVQMTSDVCRAVSGMEITTVQWPEKGGLATNFKVMAIQVPQIRSQFVGTSTSSSKCGIVHGTTS